MGNVSFLKGVKVLRYELDSEGSEELICVLMTPYDLFNVMGFPLFGKNAEHFPWTHEDLGIANTSDIQTGPRDMMLPADAWRRLLSPVRSSAYF